MGNFHQFESASRPGHFYTVRQAADGSWYCDCPKWRFQKGVPPKDRRCQHVNKVLDREADAAMVPVTVVAEVRPEPVRSAKPTKPDRIERRGAFWR